MRVRQRTPSAAASARQPASANAVASLASSATVPGDDRADQRSDAPADREQPHGDALPDARALGAVGGQRIGGGEADRLRDPARDHGADERGRPERQRHGPERGREQQRPEPDELEPVEPVGDARERERRDRGGDRNGRERGADAVPERPKSDRCSEPSVCMVVPAMASTISATLADSSQESSATVRRLSRSGTCSCFGPCTSGSRAATTPEQQHEHAEAAHRRLDADELHERARRRSGPRSRRWGVPC